MSENDKELCVNTGNWIQMCNALDAVTKNEWGDIQAQRMSSRERDSVRLQIVAGHFKKNRVVLNHCPFCGVDIRTEHKEKPND